MNRMSSIIKNITKITAGFILMFGFYLFVHGHISHGAGFAGGVIITLTFMLVMIVFGKHISLRKANENSAALVLNVSVLVFLLLSVSGMFFGRAFMENFLPPGKAGTLFSSGTVALSNILLCTAAASSLFLVFLSLVLYKVEGKNKQ